MSTLRPELLSVVSRLIARGETFIDLDRLGDEIGALAVSADDVDAIVNALEAAGHTVGSPHSPAASAGLLQVLQAARRLRAELGRTPSPLEIADREQLELSTVRMALLFARIVQR